MPVVSGGGEQRERQGQQQHRRRHRLFGVPATFTGAAEPTALLSNAARANELFGYPAVPLRTLIEWTAEWVLGGGETHGKDTHFQEREGRF
ncbi:hypothetical protein [Micromonospora sp. NPDC023814]|uniref:hypothetical protein n=1 Tax=Micromonospora sp. NPDC023814 TaxID=3154596 RepID=UPI0033CD698A